MRLMPVSPPSVGVVGQALPAVDWQGGSVPSSARQGSLLASLQMVLAERVLLSSLPASELASRLASLQALLRVSLEWTSLRSSPEQVL